MLFLLQPLELDLRRKCLSIRYVNMHVCMKLWVACSMSGERIEMHPDFTALGMTCMGAGAHISQPKHL